MFVEVGACVPDAWVEVALLGVHGDGDAQEGAAGECWEMRVDGRVEGESEASGEGGCADAGEVEVETLGLLFVGFVAEEGGMAGAAYGLDACDLTGNDALGAVG